MDAYLQIIINMRITLDIDGPILLDLKRLKKKEGKSMGRLVSDLLAQALKGNAASVTTAPPTWIAKRMGARINLESVKDLHSGVR